MNAAHLKPQSQCMTECFESADGRNKEAELWGSQTALFFFKEQEVNAVLTLRTRWGATFFFLSVLSEISSGKWLSWKVTKRLKGILNPFMVLLLQTFFLFLSFYSCSTMSYSSILVLLHFILSYTASMHLYNVDSIPTTACPKVCFFFFFTIQFVYLFKKN